MYSDDQGISCVAGHCHHDVEKDHMRLTRLLSRV